MWEMMRTKREPMDTKKVRENKFKDDMTLHTEPDNIVYPAPQHQSRKVVTTAAPTFSSWFKSKEPLSDEVFEKLTPKEGHEFVRIPHSSGAGGGLWLELPARYVYGGHWRNNWLRVKRSARVVVVEIQELYFFIQMKWLGLKPVVKYVKSGKLNKLKWRIKDGIRKWREKVDTSSGSSKDSGDSPSSSVNGGSESGSSS